MQNMRWLVPAALAAVASWVLWVLVQHPTWQTSLKATGTHGLAVLGEWVKQSKEHALLESCAMLAAAVAMVGGVRKLRLGDAILGYLLAGAVVGPHALNLVQDVANVQHLGELGVVFLLFNIGMELSLERLRDMARLVFGMGGL